MGGLTNPNLNDDAAFHEAYAKILRNRQGMLGDQQRIGQAPSYSPESTANDAAFHEAYGKILRDRQGLLGIQQTIEQNVPHRLTNPGQPANANPSSAAPSPNPLLQHPLYQALKTGAQAAQSSAPPATPQPITDPASHPTVPPLQSSPMHSASSPRHAPPPPLISDPSTQSKLPGLQTPSAQPKSILGMPSLPQAQMPSVSGPGVMDSPLPSGGAAPMLPPNQSPSVGLYHQSPIDRDQAEQDRLIRTGSGISQIHSRIENSSFGQAHPLLGKILGYGAQIPLTLADAAASTVAPALAANLPGTELHHERLLRQNGRQLGEDVGNAEKQAQTGEAEAHARELDAQPELQATKAQLAQEKQDETENHHQSQIDQQLRQHGFKANHETGAIEPLGYEEMSEPQQAAYDLKNSQSALADANAQLAKAKNDPNSPLYKEAMDKISSIRRTQDIALQRLGLSREQFMMRSRGTDMHGNPLPGAMLTGDEDNPTPVGTAFQQNIRPTGHERNVADLANSASKQIDDMKAIVQKHPDFFGPGFGQSTEFKNWIGSGDPDAKRFIAARTIAADHLAGTFGGRSEAALNALDSALGQFKENPKAALAGLDQLAIANKSFQKAGTVRTAGAGNPPSEPFGQGPRVGMVQDGYRFKGGDPGKQSSWEKVQ